MQEISFAMISLNPPSRRRARQGFSSLFSFADDVVHQSRKAEHDARLHIRRRVFSDSAAGRFDLHAGELCRSRNEGIHRTADAGRNRSADELALLVDGVERRRRAEIDDDEGRAVLLNGGDVVDDPVRPPLPARRPRAGYDPFSDPLPPSAAPRRDSRRTYAEWYN